MRTRLRVLALVAVLALALAACSDDGGDDASGDTAAATGATETTTGATAATGATTTGATGETSSGAAVATADSDLGEIVTDAEGRTLYVFLPDEGGESTCYDDCEANWPPLTTEGTPTGDGVDASLLGTTEREDGSTQVTLDGWPLYYFAADEAAGDVNGQAVGEVWYVVAPDGTHITDAPA